MLRDNHSKTYIDNLKIFNLDIIKCYKMYYNCSNLKDLSNSTKWGEWIKKSSLRYYKELAEEVRKETRKEVTNKVEENNINTIKSMFENNMDYDLISQIKKSQLKK